MLLHVKVGTATTPDSVAMKVKWDEFKKVSENVQHITWYVVSTK